jgi:hypothetical protein
MTVPSFQPLWACDRYRSSNRLGRLPSPALRTSPQQGDEQIASSDVVDVQVPREVVMRVVRPKRIAVLVAQGASSSRSFEPRQFSRRVGPAKLIANHCRGLLVPGVRMAASFDSRSRSIAAVLFGQDPIDAGTPNTQFHGDFCGRDAEPSDLSSLPSNGRRTALVASVTLRLGDALPLALQHHLPLEPAYSTDDG